MAKVKELPKINYKGKEYYVDFKLEEFRSVGAPIEFIKFDSEKGKEIGNYVFMNIDDCLWKGVRKWR